jgi:transposase
MRKVREVLRLKFERGLSDRKIASSCRIARSTVGEYLRRAQEAGVTWEAAQELDDGRLDGLLFPPVPVVAGKARRLPDWEYINREMKKPGVTLFLLWQEYKEVHPDGYQYSRFCDYYRKWLGKQEISMRQHHVAGEKLFLDYAGQTMRVVDPGTGEIREAQIFLAALGASNYTYCEATWTQQLPDWIGSHTRALTYFGGCPQVLVPDNLKSGVKDPHLYEPELNPTYQEMARHYGVAVVPARKGHPKDKAKVENAVLVAERWILARIRNRTFFSLRELNEAIAELLVEFNERPFQKQPGYRRSLFEELDKPTLGPLPEPFEYATWRKVRANIDYHVEVDGHYYSVPYQLRKKQLEARVTAGTVEVYHKSKRVASHARSHRRGRHTTVNEHMPEAHRQYAEWTPKRLVDWASKNGEATAQVIQGILESRTHPQHGYRSCLGIMRLGKTCGSRRLEAACHRALALNSLSYKSIKSILDNGLENRQVERKQQERPAIKHGNIRGPHYYANNASNISKENN